MMWPARVLRALAHPVVQEAKRQVCFRGWGQVRFATDTFGYFEFTCGNRIEYYRTVEFGGEAEALGAFLFLLRPDDVVWDVGASVGLFAVHAAALVTRVVAFEPDPATHRRLSQNVGLNRLKQKVDCRELAVGAAPGILRLSSDGLDGNAPSLADLGRHTGSCEVAVETVDRLVEQGVPRPSVIKLDIEGAEGQALEGARSVLNSTSRPRVLFVEVHPNFLARYDSPPQVVENILAQSGYRIIGTRKRGEQYHLVGSVE